MPDTITLTGLSFGLLAGIVSGVCYLVANGVVWPKGDNRSISEAESEEKIVCSRCGGNAHGSVLPCICVHKDPVKFEKGAWFLRQVQKTISLMPWAVSTEKLAQIEEEREGHDSDGDRAERSELHNVRHFLETLSAKLAGGPLDRTNVSPLYDHPSYLPQRRDFISPTRAATTGASGAHAQLKRLVARVVEEAAALPALSRYAAESPNTPNIEASTYEDLLATAILNKVIERYQTENGSGGRSSGIHSASASPTTSERSSPRSLHSREQQRNLTSSVRADEDDDEVSDWEEGDVTDDALEMPRRVPFPEFGGDIVHTRENAERDYDEISGSDIQAADGSWEENWLFQKKKIKTLQSVPVPMLVPNSNTDYRALIGDRDADDTTDLSDNASDAENDETEVKSDLKRIVDSKHIIGGKPKLEISDFEPDSLTSMDGVMDFDSLDSTQFNDNEKLVDAVNNELENEVNDAILEANNSIVVVGVDSGPLGKAEFAVEEIHRMNGNVEVVKDVETAMEPEKDTSEQCNKYAHKDSTNTLNGHEREGEYEETVAVPVQRYADSLRRKHFETEIPTRDTDPQHLEDDLIPGSIADRERKKWLNYVEMPNNPYSPEAIQKRLSAKSNSAIFDIITKTKDLPDDKYDEREENSEENCTSEDKIEVENENRSGSNSPAPKLLKDVLAEEAPEFKRYGRDYYIRDAKKSTGSRKRNTFSDTSSISSLNKSMSLDNFDDIPSPGHLIKQFKTIATNQQFRSFAKDVPANESFTTTCRHNDNNKINIDYDDFDNPELYTAKPAFVDEIDSPIDPKSPLDKSFVSTSSNEDSIKIYNIQTGEVVKCKPQDNVSPRYGKDDDDNFDRSDKADSVDACRKKNSVGSDDELIKHKLDDISELEEIALPKVKELAKIFRNMEPIEENLVKPSQRRKKSFDFLSGEIDYVKSNKPLNKQAYMHSLTARSISKEFRDELKLSMATPLKVPGGTNEVPEGIEEVIKESAETPESPRPEPGTIKSKLAFFESLKPKVNGK